MRNKYLSYVKSSAVNSELEQTNKFSLQMFYTAKLENVYYSEKSLGPQRKYYKIVEKGELYLKENIASWNEIVRIFHELEIM